MKNIYMPSISGKGNKINNNDRNLKTEVYDDSYFGRKWIKVDPFEDDRWEYLKIDNRRYNRVNFSVKIEENGLVTWVEQISVWGNSEQVREEIQKTIDSLTMQGCVCGDSNRISVKLGDLVAIMTWKEVFINRNAPISVCSFEYPEPLVGCSFESSGLVCGGYSMSAHSDEEECLSD